MNVKKTLPALYDMPWAIAGEGFETISRAVEKSGAVEAILARPGIQMSGASRVSIRGRVAIVEMIGPVMHYGGGVMSWLFGFPSAEGLLTDVQAAEDNPAVESIVLHIDSPGGQVGGIAELANHIREKITKPIVAYVGDMAASAAYWVASAADSIIAAPTAEIGSIGVIFTMRRREDNQIEIVSSVSPRKRVDPETDEGRQTIQARADALADVFVSQVATNRKLSVDQVTSIGGDVVIAAKAIEKGLVDGIGSLEQVILDLSQKGVNFMDLQKLKADYPDLHVQVMNAGRAEALETAKIETKAAVDAIKASTLDMVTVVLGDDARAKLDQVMVSGMTAEQVKVSKELFGKADASGTTTREEILDGIRGNTATPATPAVMVATVGDAESFLVKVSAYQAEHNCKRSVAIGAIAAADTDLYTAWLKAQQK